MPKNNKERVRFEKQDSPEIFRGTLGFDFIFIEKDGKKVPICVEINGERAGIFGVQDIPNGELDSTRRIMADVRTHIDGSSLQDTKAFMQRIDAMGSDYDKGDLDILDSKGVMKYMTLLRDKYADIKLFKHSYADDPAFFRLLKDKSLQQSVIPDENKLPVYEWGSGNASESGYWIVKPIYGDRGDGIKIISNKDLHILDELFDSGMLDGQDMKDDFIVQELGIALPADNDTSNKKRPSSMRLLIDFRYLENDKIEVDYAMAYQRISNPDGHDTDEKALVRKYVVNKSKGAKATICSDEEYASAYRVALDIIHNMAKWREDFHGKYSQS